MLHRFLVCLLLAACGGETSEAPVRTPYRPGETTVVGELKGGETFDQGECSDAQCGDVDKECGSGAAADVVLDEDGNVVDVLCYRRDVEVEVVASDVTGTVTAGNDTVVVLDGADDGVDIDGDVEVQGNNAVIWGDGPETSIISGTVDVEKNNAIVRGVRIQSDVTIEKNNTSLAFCVIEGDLVITGNNTTVAECVVFGSVRITGLNTVLVQNDFAGTNTVLGHNLTCNGNHEFDDENGNLRFDEGERTGDVRCAESDEPPDPQTDVPTGDGGT